jgi:hypothetical protein
MESMIVIVALLLCDWAVHEVIRSKRKGKGEGLAYAIFTPGAVVSEIRGKIASSVFSRNRGGAIIRNRIKPINRRSVGQSTRRQVLGSLASAWRGLTQAQRDTWNSATGSFQIQNRLGQTISMSGEQLYVRMNANLVLIGASTINSAPAPFAFAIFTVSLAVEDPTVASTFTVTFTPTPMTAGNTLAIFATRNLSPGIEAPGASEFRYIAQIDPSDTSTQNFITEYVAEFGEPVAGQKVFLEARPIATASGQPGTPLRASAIVTVSSV